MLRASLTLFLMIYLSIANGQSNRRIGQNKVVVTSGNGQGCITLKRGNTVSILTKGTIRFGAFAGSGDADGIDGFTMYNQVSDYRHGALLGRINNGPWFLVGTDALFVADRDGTLTLFVNDAATHDNEGSFIVEYSINKPLVGQRRSQTDIRTATQTSPQTTSGQPNGKSSIVYIIIWTYSNDESRIYISNIIKAEGCPPNKRSNGSKWDCGDYGYEIFRGSANLWYDLNWSDYGGFNSRVFEDINSARNFRNEKIDEAMKSNYSYKQVNVF